MIDSDFILQLKALNSCKALQAIVALQNCTAYLAAWA